MEHRYGPRVHLSNDTFTNGVLARLCQKQTIQPEINRLVERLYSKMIVDVLNEQFQSEKFSCETRMTEYHPEQKLNGTRVSPNQKAVCVNLARAGTFPSHICYEILHEALTAENIRQDHIFAARQTDADERVTGTQLGSTKIGGSIKDATVLFPDPMGATGNTMSRVIDYYKKSVPGPARKYIALNLIVTPEYLKRVLTDHPDVEIYALRLDRGLSSQAVLNTVPGTHWEQEKGLNKNQYILPGGGGFGEIMNNAYV